MNPQEQLAELIRFCEETRVGARRVWMDNGDVPGFLDERRRAFDEMKRRQGSMPMGEAIGAGGRQ